MYNFKSRGGWSVEQRFKRGLKDAMQKIDFTTGILKILEKILKWSHTFEESRKIWRDFYVYVLCDFFN